MPVQITADDFVTIIGEHAARVDHIKDDHYLIIRVYNTGINFTVAKKDTLFSFLDDKTVWFHKDDFEPFIDLISHNKYVMSGDMTIRMMKEYFSRAYNYYLLKLDLALEYDSKRAKYLREVFYNASE